MSLWWVRRSLRNGLFEVLAEKLPTPGRKSIPFALNNNACQYHVCNYGGPHTCMSCIVFWSLGEPLIHVQRKNRYLGPFGFVKILRFAQKALQVKWR